MAVSQDVVHRSVANTLSSQSVASMVVCQSVFNTNIGQFETVMTVSREVDMVDMVDMTS